MQHSFREMSDVETVGTDRSRRKKRPQAVDEKTRGGREYAARCAFDAAQPPAVQATGKKLLM
jgi:hypothetical protein